MTRKKHGADASSSSPSPQGRIPQTGARLETGRRRTSRNGAVAFTIIVFAAACALVLACAQLLAGVPSFSRLALAATSAAVNCASISSSDMPSSWQRCRYSAVTISAVTSAETPGLFELDAASSIPVWLQLKNRFIYLITSGIRPRLRNRNPNGIRPRVPAHARAGAPPLANAAVVDAVGARALRAVGGVLRLRSAHGGGAVCGG